MIDINLYIPIFDKPFMTITRMTGINTVIFYSSKIFHIAGVDNPIMATASVCTTNVLATIASVFLVGEFNASAFIERKISMR